MAKAFAIVTPNPSATHIEGMEDYRPISAFSFLGRYRIVDFPISNLSNSDIDRIQVYVSQNPRSLAEHLGTGRHYNINSKRGKLQLLFNQDSRINNIYNTDIAAFSQNIKVIERMQQPYVIITPGYMVFKQDFKALLQQHVDSEADVTLLYQKVDNADKYYQSCEEITLNKQKGVRSIEKNIGQNPNANIFMDTYVMTKELFLDLIAKAKAASSSYRLIDILNDMNEELDIRGIEHTGFLATINSIEAYFHANMDLLNTADAADLFTPDWPIYTRTTDSSPVRYYEGAKVKNTMIANGCQVLGTVENSIIGRGVRIEKGAVVKNCVILGHSTIGEGVNLEYQVIDKWATVTKTKSLVGEPNKVGYVRRDDNL